MSMTLKPAAAAVPAARCADRGRPSMRGARSTNEHDPCAAWLEARPHIPRHIAIVMDGNGRWATSSPDATAGSAASPRGRSLECR
jgi:hypothetical protein